MKRLCCNSAVTENTRASYPIEYIPNAHIPCVGPHPKNLILLCCDAFGVLPPVSRLTPEQAMYHFISGYTAKVLLFGYVLPPKYSCHLFVPPCLSGVFMLQQEEGHMTWCPREARWLLYAGMLCVVCCFARLLP